MSEGGIRGYVVLIASIEIKTDKECLTLLKRGCWTPYPDWFRWIKDKPAVVQLKNVTERSIQNASESE